MHIKVTWTSHSLLHSRRGHVALGGMRDEVARGLLGGTDNRCGRLQEGSTTPGQSLLSDMRTNSEGDATGLDFEDLEGASAVLQEASVWAPTAVALDNVKLRGSASFDIITTLVDIYGDALFVSEYKCGLCERCNVPGFAQLSPVVGNCCLERYPRHLCLGP